MNELMRRRRALMGAKKSAPRLPAEFQEVEYVESAGNAGINTNLTIPATAIKFIAKYTANNSVMREEYIFAERDSNGVRLALAVNTSSSSRLTGIWSSLNARTAIPETPNEPLFELTMEIGGPNISTYATCYGKVNGVPITPISSTGTSRRYGYIDFRLFYANTATMFAGKLYSLSIYSENTICFDFVPCYRKSDTAVGLYEIVTGAFFTSNNLTKGADV